jgi:aminoglycoside/choline kinase family phosphotransferase/dTDP-glucose pyrophosphorylase
MGEPMLARILDMLVSWGVEEIAVNAHYLADQIADFVKEYSGDGGKGVKITVSREDEILGTGGVLRPLRKWIGSDPFWLVNGDIVVEDVDPEPIEDAFERSGRFAACWMSEDFGPRTIEADPEGRVCNWRSDDAGFPGTYTYTGVAILSPEVADYLPPVKEGESGFCSIVDAYEKAMMTDARFVVGVQEPEAMWCDAGTGEVYRELNSEPMAPSLFGDSRLNALVGALGWKDDETLAEYLGARGSDRMFYRLVRGFSEDANNTTPPVLGVVYEEARKENANARFAAVTRFLASKGVRVPKLLADLPEQKAYATGFVEGRSLEAVASEKGVDFIKLYLPVLESLKGLWSIPLDDADMPELEPAFGEELFAWERGLFVRECVKGRYGIESLPANVESELVSVAERLSAERKVLVHRDFQSANVLYSGDDRSKPWLIDYQGMRPGPAAYDVASLLYDPYVPMDDTSRKLLIELAAKLGPSAPSAETVVLAAVQRLCQALGAFCRLSAAGQPQFERYVERALGNVHHAAHDAGLSAFAEFTHQLIHHEKMR